MKKKTLEIKQGIKAHIIQTDLFKTNLVCIIITVPLNKESVTKNALIPFMLRRGTAKLKDQSLINKELENMYGAAFNCGIDKLGDNQVLKFYIDSIDDSYTLDNEQILEKSINSLLDIVFNPFMEDGKFKQDFLNVEKENLKKVIESKIDDKDSYALDKCISNMYNDEGFGIYKYGYIQDIEKIDLEDLSIYYNNLIQNSKIDIFISGNFDENNVKQILLDNENVSKLKPRVENYILNNEFTESKQKVENVKEIEEKMDITQGKLILGLDILSNIPNLQSVALVYNAILGDGVNSMLFQNVREKAGLAYSTKSSYIKQKANIFIKCGIQIENYRKALDIVKEQLANIKSGIFTDEDIENAKTYLVSGIKTIEAEQDTEVIFYIGQEITKTETTIEEYIEKISFVTKDQIVSLANAIEVNTIYFLRD